MLDVAGSESPAWKPEAETMAGALPNARITVLEGQKHIADLRAPEVVAKPLLAFLAERP
jgi:pimeloyl-ACP methyl ester carboxylesterase